MSLLFSFFHFILLFWNQIFTCLSVKASAWETSILRFLVRYGLKRNSFSSSRVWNRLYVCRPLLLPGAETEPHYALFKYNDTNRHKYYTMQFNSIKYYTDIKYRKGEREGVTRNRETIQATMFRLKDTAIGLRDLEASLLQPTLRSHPGKHLSRRRVLI